MIQSSPKALPAIRAFTYLGSRVRLSIVGNSITFYPCLAQEEDAIAFRKKVLLKMARDHNLDYISVYRQNMEHEHYHQDAYNRNEKHWHWHFKQHLSAPLLKLVLNYLVLGNFCSDLEAQTCLAEFENATLLPAEVFEQIITQDCFSQLKLAIDRAYPAETSPLLHQHLQEILSDFERLILLGKKLPKLRYYMNLVKLVIEEPTPLHLQALEDIAHETAKDWPVLSTLCLIFGTIVLASSIGMTGAFVPTVLVGAGFFASGMYGLSRYCAANEEQNRTNDLKDVSLSENLLGWTRSVRR